MVGHGNGYLNIRISAKTYVVSTCLKKFGNSYFGQSDLYILVSMIACSLQRTSVYKACFTATMNFL